MLELTARGGMRIGEVLKIRPIDIQDRKITLPDPKSGKESEVVIIPQKVADRLKENRLEAGVCFLRPVRCAQLSTLDSESNMVLPTSCGNCCKLNSQMPLKIINLLDRKLNKRHPVIRNHPAA